MRFTKEDEALFLLDEPDTHLNPNWSVQYLEFMHRVVGDQPTSQAIMSTHNPLVIVGIAASIVEDLQNALEQFMAIAEDLGGKTNSNSGPLFL